MKPGTVYFVGPWGFRVIKIGFAVDWAERLRALQIGNPDELRLYALIPGSLELEAELHRRFASQWIRGEWFRNLGDLKTYLAGLQRHPATIYHRLNGGREPR